MSELTPVFPIAVSSTLVAAYKQCPTKFFNEYIINRVPKGESPDLVAGSSYAKGHEVFRKEYYSGRMNEEQALIASVIAIIKEYGDLNPDNSYKTWDRVCDVFCAYYQDEYPPQTDFISPLILNGEPSVEFSFAIPLPIMHPDTDEPIIYAGRFDSIMEMGGAGNFGFDDKTTKQMGPKWAEQWDLRAQFTGYMWGAREHGLDLTGFIVRGAAIQKTQCKFAQAITYRPEWTIQRWYESLLHNVDQMVRDYRDGYWDVNLDFACTMYGSCSFKILCDSKDPSVYYDQYFTDRTWEPVVIEGL